MLFTSISQAVPHTNSFWLQTPGSWRPWKSWNPTSHCTLMFTVIFMSTIITSPVLVRRGTKAAHGRLLYHWRQLTKAPWQREIFVSEMQQTNLSWETSKIAERLHLMLKTYCRTVTKILMESRGDRFTDHRSSRTTAWQRQAIRRLQPWQTSMVQMFFNHGKTMENPNTNGILLK